MRSVLGTRLILVLISILMWIGATRPSEGAEYRFYHPDPVGSNLLVTTQEGRILERSVVMPYGELVSASDGDGRSVAMNQTNTRHLFTGAERDAESGLDHMGPCSRCRN